MGVELLDTRAYWSIPWEYGGRSREGADCWGLIVIHYREALGITLPNHSLSDLEEQFEAYFDQDLWQEVEQPQTHDIVCFVIPNLMFHVGIVVDSSNFLHMPLKGPRPRVSSLTTGYWKRHISVYGRYL